MRIIKILSVILAVLLGLAAGLAFGWLASPAPPANTSLETLRQDYQADYVLMVAEVYQKDGDLEQAAGRLTRLGDTPAALAQKAVAYASQSGYALDDLRRMADLTTALQNATSGLTGSGGQP